MILYLCQRVFLRPRRRAALLSSSFAVVFGVIFSALFLLAAATPSTAQVRASVLLGADYQSQLPLSDTAIAAHERFQKLRPLIPTSVAASLAFIAPDIAIGSSTSVIDAHATQSDWSFARPTSVYRFKEGTYPKFGEIAISASLAAALRVRVGGSVMIGLSRAPLVVVGIYQNAMQLSSVEALLPSGALEAMDASNRSTSSIPLSALVLSKATAGGPSPNGLTEANLQVVGQTTSASDIPDTVPLWMRAPELVGIPAGAALAGAIFGLLAVAFQRQRRDFALLQLLGVSARTLRRAFYLTVLALAGLGAGVGAALGGLVGAFVGPSVSSSADLAPESALPASSSVVLVILAVALVSAMGSVVVARRALKDSSQGLLSRPNVEAAISVPRVSPVAVALFAMSVAAFAIVQSIPANPWLTAVGEVSLVLALVSGLRQALNVFVGRSATAPIPVFLAARLARADPNRTYALAIAAALALAAPAGLAAVNQSYLQAQATSFTPQVPVGQIEFRIPSTAVNQSVLYSHLEAASPGKVLRVERPIDLGDASSERQVVVGSGDSRVFRDILVVSSRRQASIILGWQLSETDWVTVRSGHLLLLDPRLRGGPVRIEKANESAALPVGATFAHALPSNGARYQAGAVLSKEAAEAVGLPVAVTAFRVYDPRDRSAVTKIAAAAGIPPGLVIASDPPSGLVPFSGLLMLACLSGLAIAIMAVTCFVARRELQAAARRLSAIGLSARSIQVTGCLTLSLPAVLGVLVGLLAGIGAALHSAPVGQQAVSTFSLLPTIAASLLIIIVPVVLGAALIRKNSFEWVSRS